MLRKSSKDEISLKSVVSMMKDMEKRLELMEHELWNLKFSLTEMTQGKAKHFLNPTSDTHSLKHNIDAKVPKTDVEKEKVEHEEPFEDHLKEARSFIKNMVEHDIKDVQDQLQMRSEAFTQFMPHIEDVPASKTFSQKFLTSLDSENLFNLFKSEPVKKNGELDNYLMDLTPDMKVRRVSLSIKYGNSNPKIKNNLNKSKIKKTKGIKGTVKKQSVKTITIKQTKQKKQKKQVKQKKQTKQRIVLKKASKGKEFILSRGKKAKDLKELYNLLMKATDKTYAKHVTSKKNAFSDWTGDVLGYKRLAGLIKLTRSKKELTGLLKKTLSS